MSLSAFWIAYLIKMNSRSAHCTKRKC